jgi:uncharacterized protein YebE (UPF0316 family)
MMDPLAFLPPFALAGVVFLLRMVDVSLGTMRTLAVVQGRTATAMLLGFLEVTVWVTAISQVLTNLTTAPYLIAFYAGGFAAGNAAGIALERRLALGQTALRLITAQAADVAAAVQQHGSVLLTVGGAEPTGDRSLLYASCARRQLGSLIEAARRADPDVFYVVERFAELSRLTPLPPTTGWRSVMKKK